MFQCQMAVKNRLLVTVQHTDTHGYTRYSTHIHEHTHACTHTYTHTYKHAQGHAQHLGDALVHLTGVQVKDC